MWICNNNQSDLTGNISILSIKILWTEIFRKIKFTYGINRNFGHQCLIFKKKKRKKKAKHPHPTKKIPTKEILLVTSKCA